MHRMVVGASVAAFVVGVATEARADDCGTLGLTNTVVIESGDTQEPLLKALGRKLRNSKYPVTILYTLKGTCALRDDMYDEKTLAAGTVMSYAPSSLETATWNPTTDLPKTCTLDAASTIQLAIGATYLSSCSAKTPVTPLTEIKGPIQGYGFAVPLASDQQAITAEEGYFAFGFGAEGGVTPWNEPLYMFGRTNTKSTALTCGAAVGINPAQIGKTKWQKYDASNDVLTHLIDAALPKKSIGILGTEIYDANRNQVKLLAFRGFGQNFAYFPDAASSTFDKQNLRDGHYLPWSPTVYLTRSVGDASVKAVLDLVSGTPRAVDDDVDGLGTVISKGLVPECAMKVTRAESADAKELVPFDPPSPCGCYFESHVAQSTKTCTACTDNGPCGGGACRRGVCEAK